MDFRGVAEAFFVGLATAPVVNALFPVIVSTISENSASLPFHTKLVLWALPFMLLIVLFFAVIDSEESALAGGLGVAFSVVFVGGIGITGLVTLPAFLSVVATIVFEIG